MEEIRKIFVSQFHLKAIVKIAYFDYKYIYLNFANEVNYNHIYSKTFIQYGECPMKILKWTLNFKLEVETPIVLVLILIHQLPWHLFRWDVISRMVEAMGIAIASDQAIYSKSIANVANVKV